MYTYLKDMTTIQHVLPPSVRPWQPIASEGEAEALADADEGHSPNIPISFIK